MTFSQCPFTKVWIELGLLKGVLKGREYWYSDIVGILAIDEIFDIS